MRCFDLYTPFKNHTGKEPTEDIEQYKKFYNAVKSCYKLCDMGSEQEPVILLVRAPDDKTYYFKWVYRDFDIKDGLECFESYCKDDITDLTRFLDSSFIGTIG